MISTGLIVYLRTWYKPKSSCIRLDLFQFAAEDDGRTEEPTERRIREARDKGQVAKTPELSQALVLLVSFFTLYLLSLWILYEILRFTERFFTDFWLYDLTEPAMKTGLTFMAYEFFKLTAPFLGVTFLAGIIGNIVQVGFLFTLKPIALDLSKIKLDPATFMKRVLFSRQVGINLLKTFFKITVIGYLCYAIISADFQAIMKTSQGSPYESLAIIGYTVFKLTIWSSLLLLIMAIPDYFFQKSELMESLKMTKQELKQEMKEYEGDPYIKSRIRSRRQEMLRAKMLSEVPTADVVITNPVHIAVALKYATGSGAPQVIAKGESYLAQKIKEIALENNIYIMENKPLAWELYKNVEIGQQIPASLYRVVAEIFKLLIEKNPHKFAHVIPA
jgi:flagellar biosynthetic protein FlhB